ncbi:maleylpyruvate isomerase N-terminal domain-containing protein [Aestuariimicrobium ganziense]|uniref:maleylpyruvate isomerase N-terminal domain-containing protein n=1 Tax=Aestuariimicrobium ganziense TaxID=2773677 RepID=UPI0019440BAA|nr:maleylpyruvate isomerase N-terminal domain-containing protein [Aestuariimicrobium ganziense]
MSSLESNVHVYLGAARMLENLLHDVDADMLDKPGLGQWSVRDLIGHASRALLTVEHYLNQAEPDEADQLTPGGYYYVGRTRVDSELIAQRGVDAGRDLGDDPVAFVADVVGRVEAKLYEVLDHEPRHDPLVPTIAGGMRLSAYLPTRTLELVVHSLDLARALDLHPEVPADAMRQTLGVLADLAVLDGSAGDLVLAVTGRQPMPDNYVLLR